MTAESIAEQFQRVLFDIQRDIGEIKGALSGSDREFARLVGQFERHVADDASARKAQDDRLVRELGKLTARVAVLEQAKSAHDGATTTKRALMETIRLFLASVVTGIATWFVSRGH